MTPFDRFVGIDWSGAKGERQAGIAVAICDPDGSCRLAHPPGDGRWSRQAVLDLLLDCPPRTLAGMDFAFSLPWPDTGPLPPHFDQPADARRLWHTVDGVCRAEPHLHAGPIYAPEGGWLGAYMFTKLAGRALWRGSSHDPDRLRFTERVLRPHPNSVFRIVGAKTVGPGSFAGMRVLSALTRRLGDGIAVWPFDAPGDRLTMVEIYPSLYYAQSRRFRSRDPALVGAALAGFGATRDDDLVIGSQDEADALVSAAAIRHLSHSAGAFTRPRGACRQEGWIFGVPVPSELR